MLLHVHHCVEQTYHLLPDCFATLCASSTFDVSECRLRTNAGAKASDMQASSGWLPAERGPGTFMQEVGPCQVQSILTLKLSSPPSLFEAHSSSGGACRSICMACSMWYCNCCKSSEVCMAAASYLLRFLNDYIQPSKQDYKSDRDVQAADKCRFSCFRGRHGSTFSRHDTTLNALYFSCRGSASTCTHVQKSNTGTSY